MHKTKPIIIPNGYNDDWIAYHYWYTREDWKKATKKTGILRDRFQFF